jgi:hypothetical protein
MSEATAAYLFVAARASSPEASTSTLPGAVPVAGEQPVPGHGSHQICQVAQQAGVPGHRLPPAGSLPARRAGGQGSTPGPETRAVFRMALPYVTCLGPGNRC